MAKDLYILKYNNYYNRILKSENSLSNYLGYSYYKQSAVNFNKNDGVFTQCIINTEFDGDYVVVTGTGSTLIESRWFVIENKWNRLGQSILTLRRDLLVDFYAGYSNAPAFIEKGAVSSNDNFIFNDEAMTFNQIKQSQADLPDTSGKQWIVAYIASDRKSYEIDLSGGGELNFKITISGNRNQTNKQPYDMIVIPPAGYNCNMGGTIYGNTTNSETSFLAEAISKTLSGAGVLYDIQKLPYCPFIGASSWSISSTTITCNGANLDYTHSISNDSTPSIILYCPQSDFSFTIARTYPYDNSSSNINKKVDSSCRFVRICSPNNAASFDFNASKNGSSESITYNVHCTYRPYSPFIHIYPTFGGLYKESFTKENRGLICQGDFSMPQLTDAWETYQINNKNYLNVFNRQVENLEVSQKYQRISQAIGIGTSALSTGASMGALTGIAGGVAAGVASLGGGIADYIMSDKIRNETLDYTKDMFGYQLENIQAMPVTLAKMSAFDIDSHLFPFIEYYSASDVEINALKEKIKYNGMSIGRIGTFADFKNRASSACQYIKCQLIRATSISDDFHLVKELADELYKGVYIV